MNGEKQYESLELGKTYKFAGYDWTVCKLINDGSVAVIQSHGVTHGAWPGYAMQKFGEKANDMYGLDIDGKDISAYDSKMKELYDAIKDAEYLDASYGKGLFLISKEKADFARWGQPGSGYYWQALKEAAENVRQFGSPNYNVWFGTVFCSNYTWFVNSDGNFYGSYQNNDFVVAPAFNLDLSKVEIVGDEIVIKGRSYDNTNTDKSLIVEKNVKKVRLILAATEQVSENNFERHYKTIEIEVPESIDLACYDIIGGEWIS